MKNKLDVLSAGTLLVLGCLTACGAPPETEPAPSTPAVDPRVGFWQRLDPADGDATESEPGDPWNELLEISAESWTWASQQRVERSGPIVAQTASEIEVSLWGIRQSFSTALNDDGTLQLRWTKTPLGQPDSEPQDIDQRYQRLTDRPRSLVREPMALGAAAELEPAVVESLTTDLAARTQRDQEAREFSRTGQRPTSEQIAEMMAVDQDNTAWLKQTVAQVGWINVERFGEQATKNAFLLVQHSGDLPLMLDALPRIEEDVKSGILHGGSYALLFDRSQLAQGKHQRYGSQLVPGPDGMFVAPLEDPAQVDARRAELGMQPLTDYLAFFRDRQPNGEIAIREEF